MTTRTTSGSSLTPALTDAGPRVLRTLGLRYCVPVGALLGSIGMTLADGATAMGPSRARETVLSSSGPCKPGKRRLGGARHQDLR